MCSTDSTYSSSDSSSFIRKRSRIFSLFKFNGSKMEDHLHRKLSEPNPAELLLYRKRGAPSIKLWTPENTEDLRASDDLNLEKLQRKRSVTDKFKRHKSRKGTVTSEDDDSHEGSRRSSTPLKRSNSFRESWNRLWHKTPKYSNNNDSISSSGSEKSERRRNKPEEISAINSSSDTTTDNDKNHSNEVKIKDNNDNFLSVMFANHNNRNENNNNDNVKNLKRDKLSRSVNDLSTVCGVAALKPDTIYGDSVSLDKCQNIMVIKGHTRRRSWSNYFTSG